MKWLKDGPSPHQTALAMIGAKRSDRILVIGAGCGPLAAELGLVTGLNGRVLVVDRDPAAQAAIEAAAASAGALIEFAPGASTAVAADPAAFDIVVLHHELGALSTADARLAVAEARRLLRAGGRLVVMERTSHPGWLARLQGGPSPPPALAPRAVIDLVQADGFLAVRLLADSLGTAYVEGRRPM
jgi:ubiquinone/menaquinone biosynthesis C-methylase UbiE